MWHSDYNRIGVKGSPNAGGMTRRTFVGLSAAWAGVMSQGTLLAQSDKAQEQRASRGATEHNVKLSWRIGADCYLTDVAFDQLITFLRKHPAVLDEICLFDSSSNLVYIPPERLEKTAAVMARRFTAFRQADIRSVGAVGKPDRPS